MDTTGTFPILQDSDTVYSVKDYAARMAAALGQGVGWTGVTLTDTTNFGVVSGYPWQIKRYGQIVYMRGLLVTKSATLADKVAGTIPVGFRPSQQHAWLPASVAGSAVTQPRVGMDGNVVPFFGGGYYYGTLAGGYAVSLTGSWAID